MNGKDFNLQPADLGENILTRDLDVLALPRGTPLHFSSLLMQSSK